MGLNASKVKAPTVNKDYQRIEVGNYLARLVQVIDLGLQPQRPYKGQEKPPAHEIMLTYELGTEFMKDEEGNDIEDKPRWISETIPFLSLKAELAKSTKRINALDPKLEFGGDFAEMTGLPCTVTVTHNPHKTEPEKVYVNVGNVTPPMKGIPIPELVNPAKVFDLSEPDLEILGSLPEWVQDKIKSNLEFNGSTLYGMLNGDAPKEAEPVAETEEEDVESPFS
ncbi:MAG: hypothetical protein Unbinned6805contig1000_14 [Prokaryotic dsDNA virus sp.]|nr:MAG: hypothetical protein Unbinned6805contig1000_14 [Prokaryotic dsDNA virus sp.]|tara:strand:- start:21146 stop:21817 length:672 start_codon:yes stop_codon:yes gene_type:complete